MEFNIGSGREDWPPMGEHVGPDVVWLTDREEPWSRGLALDGTLDGTDKTEVCITVEVADAVEWWDFVCADGIHPRWQRRLEEGRAPATWRNVVGRSRWR